MTNLWLALMIASISAQNINIDTILRSDYHLQSYENTLVFKGSCPPDNTDSMDNLPKALQVVCSKYNSMPKEANENVMVYIQYLNELEEWDKLVEKYNPDYEYPKDHNTSIMQTLPTNEESIEKYLALIAVHSIWFYYYIWLSLTVIKYKFERT
uniref:Uncharacterized protein n=1 Tax=Stomoxys calcitrans TaxID=35570 RepID=A0A2Y9D4K8_STOCA